MEMTVKEFMDKREKAVQNMMDVVLTEDVAKAVYEAIKPNLNKFRKEHPTLAVSYEFTVKIDDGFATIRAQSKLADPKLRLLRKLVKQELEEQFSQAAE